MNSLNSRNTDRFKSSPHSTVSKLPKINSMPMIESAKDQQINSVRSIDSLKALRYARVPLISDSVKKEVVKSPSLIDQN